MTRERLPAALAVWALTVALHDEAQGWFTLGAERWGVEGLATRVTVVAGLLAVAGVGAGVARAVRAGRPGLAVGWAAWAVAAGLVATTLQTRAELVHLGQYALIVALAGGGWRAALLGAALGAVDEGYQAVVWYADRGLDLRDIGLDVVGAVAGGLWITRPAGGAGPAMATPPAPPAPPPDPPGSAPPAAPE